MLRRSFFSVLFSLTILVSTVFAGEGQGGFVKAKGTELVLNGKPFRYVGANNYYLMVYSVQPDMRKVADEVLDNASKMGINVIRTWAFNDGKRQWNALQTSPGVYKESTFVGLDHVIAKAKEKGIYLVLSFGNNWNDYGGIKQYLDWSPTAVKKEHNEFFTDKNARQYYKDNIKAVLERENTITGVKYKDEPAIFAWELINEPRVSKDFSGDILNNWIAEMSSYVKSIDKNHLVTTGCEGFYVNANQYDWKLNGREGGDFIRNHSMPTIDIASFHLWPCSNNYCMTLEEADQWMKMHADDAKKLNKPLVLFEYGEYRGYNGDTVERDKLYKLVMEKTEEYGMAGTNFWFLMHNDYGRYDDGFGVYYPEDKATIDIIKSYK